LASRKSLFGYNLFSPRIQANSLLRVVRPDGRLPGAVFTAARPGLNFTTLRDSFFIAGGYNQTAERNALKYYPVFWNITGKKCVVIGGGEVAQRKIVRLIECGANVLVISPTLTSALAALKDNNKITHIAGEYAPEHIADAALVIGATDDDAINAAVSRDARARRIPVNIVDDPQKCDFILPSLVERGDLTIAVGTAGNSPALARYLREEMEKTYGEEYTVFTHILGQLRAKMEKNAETGKRWFEKLMAAGLLEALRRKDGEKARQIVRDETGEEVRIEF